MHILSSSTQVLYLPIALFLLLLLLSKNTEQSPLRSTRDTNTATTGRLVIQVVRSAANKFLEKNKNPEKEIEQVENRTAVSVRTTNVDQPREPTWFSRNQSNMKKMLRRNRRKRQKRGAKINNDSTYISEFPTNSRLYKVCNKLGFFLRLHEDGTVDGTRNKDDKKTLLVFESHGRSIIRIKGFVSSRYLTMNQKGVPSAEVRPKFFNTLFRLTQEENAWDTIASFKYYFEEKYDMLVGITKDATVKKPWKASPGQHATQFLPLPYKR